MPHQGPLLYPGKVLADRTGNRLFISDTGHNRIVVTDLNGKSPVEIGSGGEGFVDGGYDKARFNRQQGICLAGETLYVADTENHAIRAIDLKSKTVSTISGTGSQAARSPLDRYVGAARTSALSSPWDIIQIVPGSPAFYIAMAGPHEIWKLNLKTGKIGVWAGSGYENIEDGDLDIAKFAQPSGLATDGKNLFVADSEVSGVRVITGINTDHPEVGRIVGQGLFKFGDIDGTGADVRLQHCLGLAYGGGKLFIADTYNNKIKVCDPSTLTVKTFAGDGKPGSDGRFTPLLSTRRSERGWRQPLCGRHEQSQDSRDRYQVGSGQDALKIAGLDAPRSEKVSASRPTDHLPHGSPEILWAMTVRRTTMVPLIRLVPLVLSLVGQADQKEQARQFLDLCQAGKFTEATANFDAKMKEVLGPAKLEELWKKLGQQLGPIEKMGPARTDKVGSSTRVKIRCDYKTMPLDALVSFNAQGQIEGFFLQPRRKNGGHARSLLCREEQVHRGTDHRRRPRLAAAGNADQATRRRLRPAGDPGAWLGSQ